jgi:hypothetical protein
MSAGKRITASQVGQYAYCARAWWLGTVEGRPSANVALLAEGSQGHRRHGRQVSLALTLRRIAWASLALAVLALTLWAVTVWPLTV